MRRPVLPDRAETGVAGGLKAVLPLLGLDLALMALLLGAIGAAIALGFEMPEHMLGGMKLTPVLIAMFVVGAADRRGDRLSRLAVGAARACRRVGCVRRGAGDAGDGLAQCR